LNSKPGTQNLCSDSVVGPHHSAIYFMNSKRGLGV
jgi:hypothetical protein